MSENPPETPVEPAPDPAADPVTAPADAQPKADRPDGDYGTSKYALAVKARNDADIALLTAHGWTTKFSKASA